MKYAGFSSARPPSSERSASRSEWPADIFLARALVGTVAETISSLYVLLSVQQVVVSPWIWASALLLGFASVLARRLAAGARCGRDGSGRNAPSRHADRKGRAAFARLDFRRCLVAFSGNRALGPRAANRTGVAWIRCGLFCSRRFFLHRAGDDRSLLTRGAGDDSGKRSNRALAAQNLGRTLLRNSVTIASLAAAVAMTVGVAVMVFSFRQTVGDWINQTLIADLFIGPAANEIAGPTSFVPPAAIEYLEKNPAGRRGRYIPRRGAAFSRSNDRSGG